ncbi:MAG: ATP-binding cassette domain-containing protein [Comamonadaceae bacterium]|nr:MAG: ATP-binding cassette domain-containing protein [Comamonadaceae bacterium]
MTLDTQAPPADPAHAGDAPRVDPQAHIVFRDIEKVFPAPGGATVQALQRLSFSIRRGEIFGIIGRSGAGKSTLLRAINMLERPSGGQVLIDGQDIGLHDEDALVRLRRRIGMIFQHFNLLSAKTVCQNVGLPLRVAGVSRAAIERRVDEVLALVGLSDKAQAYPAQLSGGQQQRVGIARALVHEPSILLCDEATSALDPETTESILALLQDINRQLGLTVVLITHDMGVVRAVCDRVLVLDQGRLQEFGEVWEVFGNPATDTTRALLRPLQRDVPVDIEARLRPTVQDLQGQPGRVVLRVHYGGQQQGGGLSLQTLQLLGPDAQLLHGGLERLRGHAHGSLLVSLPHIPADLPVLARQLQAKDIQVIGHVAEP